MMQRSFGNGLSVSVLGMGCSRIGSISNSTPTREIEATLEAAIEAGVNLFDTADIYGQGDSERTLARLLHRHRDRMFVVTKVGGRHSRYASIMRPIKPLLRAIARLRPDVRNAVVAARTATVAHEFRSEDLLSAVNASRRRLKLDQLHGLLLHSPSVETLRKPEIEEFLAELLRSGKVQCVGASVDSLAALDAAVSLPAVSMIQASQEVVELLPGSATLNRIRLRNTGVFVREVLRRSVAGASHNRSPRDALCAAVAPDFVTSAIVGVSTRKHLDELLSSVA
jgi:aryl-alcohol dehydrogenase-like predicted oxidoreductase